MKIIRYALLFALLPITSTYAQFWIDAEAGIVFGTPYNKISIPNTSGTRFDLGKEFDITPLAYYRLRLGYTFNDRHTITALYAPLTATYEGTFDRVVNFNGQAFAAGQPVTALYQFNSYRLTYRYRLVRTNRFRLGVGFTAKIRDADVRLMSDTQDTHFSNVGFVPLLNLLAEFRISERWQALMEADALAGGPGRAEDVFLGLGYQLGPRWGLRAGYRVVEGGADVESVYNFTWINYAALGATVRF
ncbi:hypothetical protein [Salmonirosea aquatica]|uniref:Outer membrane beta-barrel protein n=1 Tax=Salmonirosea aquatica TaxID=2654236 RepID=A0A7C9FZW7_9BACT|nr:hypothetical protein [Cytophagaceae bacterium SJW1-29]